MRTNPQVKPPLTWRRCTIRIPTGSLIFRCADNGPTKLSSDLEVRAKIVSDCDGRMYYRAATVEKKYMFLYGAYEYYILKKDAVEVICPE